MSENLSKILVCLKAKFFQIAGSRKAKLVAAFLRSTGIFLLMVVTALFVAHVVKLMFIGLATPLASVLYPVLYLLASMWWLVWAGLAVVMGIFVWKLFDILPHWQRAIASLTFSVFFLLHPVFEHVRSEHTSQVDAWLAKECDAVKNSPIQRNFSATQILEGYLDKTDYDRLLTDRFQNNADAIEVRLGDTRTYDTSRYVSHTVFHVQGGTFAESAYRILTKRKMSFYEVEMARSAGLDGGYSNSTGLLMNKEGWKAERYYRRYYLAPIEGKVCKENLVQGSVGRSIREYAKGYAEKIERDERFCLVMELSDVALSHYVFIADEPVTYWGSGQIWGIRIPLWIRYRLERIRLLDRRTGQELVVYRAFNYPNDADRRFACINVDALGQIFHGFEVPLSRGFFLTRDWYKGSSVEQFYQAR